MPFALRRCARCAIVPLSCCAVCVAPNIESQFSSLVWHGAVHILLFTVKAYCISPILCFVMTNEVIAELDFAELDSLELDYAVKKHQRLVYGLYPRTPIYITLATRHPIHCMYVRRPYFALGL